VFLTKRASLGILSLPVLFKWVNRFSCCGGGIRSLSQSTFFPYPKREENI